MKKTLITLLIIGALAFGTVFGQEQDESNLYFDASVEVGFESSYVFRGQELSNEVVKTSVVVEFNKVYLAVDSFWSVSSSDTENETDLYAGLIVEDVLFAGTFVDVGVVGYFYDTSLSTDTVEAYIGVGADLFLVDVDGYVYYDFDRESLSVVGTVTNTLKVVEDFPLFGKVFLVTQGEVGFVTDNAGLDVVADDFEYGYAKVSSDVVVFVKGVEVSVGARYNFSDDEDTNDINDLSWGASVGYSF
jgi:hypothetical protein